MKRKKADVWLNHENKTENCEIICSLRDSRLSSTQIKNRKWKLSWNQDKNKNVRLLIKIKKWKHSRRK